MVPPPHRHRMARLHVIIACCLPLMMARLVKAINGHPPSLQSLLQRCKGMLLLQVIELWSQGAQGVARRIIYRREVIGISSSENLKNVPVEAVNGSCAWDGDALSLVLVGSERAGVSSRGATDLPNARV